MSGAMFAIDWAPPPGARVDVRLLRGLHGAMSRSPIVEHIPAGRFVSDMSWEG
jgi:hypothetical protein